MQVIYGHCVHIHNALNDERKYVVSYKFKKCALHGAAPGEISVIRLSQMPLSTRQTWVCGWENCGKLKDMT